jgi:hypothetical protein
MATSPNVPRSLPRSDYADFAIALSSGLILAICAIFFVSVLFSGKMAGSRDFVSYWATGQQLRHHADPYDWGQMMKIEHAANLDATGVLFMRNPPWSLPLAYPLGFLPLRIGAFAWNLILLGCLLTSVKLVREMHGSPANSYIHWMGVAFTPAIICLCMGQTGLFTLLGIVLFFRYQSTHPYIAGLSLWLCALKPHLFLPFSVVLLAWIIYSKSYKILVAWIAAMVSSSALATLLDPQAWTRYSALMRWKPVLYEYIPCPADTIRYWINGDWIWLQYLPAALCSVWALYYFWMRRSRWDWLENGSLLLLVSVVAAPYCFPPDQCVVIPAILHGMYKTRSRLLIAAIPIILLIIQLETWKARIISGYYLWVAPTWLVWYLLASATATRTAEAAPVTVAVQS